MIESEQQDIFDLVLSQKSTFEAGVGVPVSGDWYFQMYKHNERTMKMKNGRFPNTDSDEFSQTSIRASNNIILPIVKVAHRTEDFNVKDIALYVEAEKSAHLSFLARKRHYNWAIEHHMDTFIDELVEGLDYGFVLVKNVNRERPEVIQPQQIAFCDQTHILSGTIALKFDYSIDQLIEVGEAGGWYKDKIDVVIRDARSAKPTPMGDEKKVPQKSIEVFEVHGTFLDTWLTKEGDGVNMYNQKLSADKYSKQIHIISYTKDEDGNKKGVCLFKGPEEKSVFKVLITDPIYGRAAGRGRVEELFSSQIWYNFGLIHMTNMLKEASKVIQVTDDPGFATRNNTKNAKGGEIWIRDINTTIGQLNTQPVNYQLFDNFIAGQEQRARVAGSASDPALGLAPVSGTPLGTTQIVTQQGEGDHERRRGKIATFVHEIYTDWVMEYLVEDLNKGKEWMDDLTLEDLQYVVEATIGCEFEKYQKELVLNGQNVPDPESLQAMKDKFKMDFMKKGNKHLLKILKGEFTKKPLRIKINVAGKQKNLAAFSEKLTSIMQFVLGTYNPQTQSFTAFDDPRVVKLLNQVVEWAGLDPINPDSYKPQPMQPQQPQQTQLSPLQPQLQATNQ